MAGTGLVGAIIECRMSSTRLPGKVLLKSCGKTVLEHIAERLSRSKYINKIIFATTVNPADNVIEDLAHEAGVLCFRGPEDDVLARVLGAAVQHDVSTIVEITGDCPFVDPAHVDRCVEMFATGEYDYVTNDMIRTFPEGFSVQVFSTATLGLVDKLTDDPVDRVHVSCYIYNNGQRFRLKNWEAQGPERRPDLSVTLDTKEDIELIDRVFEHFMTEEKKNDFSSRDVIGFLAKNPEIATINLNVRRKTLREG